MRGNGAYGIVSEAPKPSHFSIARCTFIRQQRRTGRNGIMAYGIASWTPNES
jgi:hypothetical protein